MSRPSASRASARARCSCPGATSTGSGAMLTVESAPAGNSSGSTASGAPGPSDDIAALGAGNLGQIILRQTAAQSAQCLAQLRDHLAVCGGAAVALQPLQLVLD